MFGAGPIGMLAGVGTLAVTIATVATGLDVLTGPYRRDPLGARWRGMILGGLSLLPSLGAWSDLGLAVAVAWMGATALVFALVVLVSWTSR
jgi:hypothetical protein